MQYMIFDGSSLCCDTLNTAHIMVSALALRLGSHPAAGFFVLCSQVSHYILTKH